MSCQASSYPTATTIWYKDGLAVSNQYVRFVISGQNVISNLHIPATTFNDVGSYFCQFSTYAGSLNSSSATLNYSSKLIYNC